MKRPTVAHLRRGRQLYAAGLSVELVVEQLAREGVEVTTGWLDHNLRARGELRPREDAQQRRWDRALGRSAHAQLLEATRLVLEEGHTAKSAALAIGEKPRTVQGWFDRLGLRLTKAEARRRSIARRAAG